ncbi:MAG: chromate transporter [Deltaproteobacteria bacterium]|nr:chromate transporter [Deltaproteobacteria bacterium]
MFTPAGLCLSSVLSKVKLRPMNQTEVHVARLSPYQLFLTFLRITTSGFGGAMFWARRQLVEKERWLTDREFVEYLSLGQLLPGPPGLNLTVLVGYRFGGWAGALTAVVGFVGLPFLVVIGMGALYQHYGAQPMVQRALAGMSIVAAALLFATFARVVKVLPRRWQPLLIAALAFVAVGVLRWPLIWVIGTLAPLAFLAAWKERL